MAPQLGVLFGGGARYTFAPMVLAWVPLLLLADRGVWSGRLATVVVVIVAASTTGVTDRGRGPEWPDTVTRARAQCATGTDDRDRARSRPPRRRGSCGSPATASRRF